MSQRSSSSRMKVLEYNSSVRVSMEHMKRSVSLFHMADEEWSLKTHDSPSSIGCKESRAKSFHPQSGYVPTLNASTNNLWYCRVPISTHDDGSRSQGNGPQ